MTNNFARAVNDITVKDSHPLPRIDNTIDALFGAKYFSTADLKSGYYQIPVAEKDRYTTAFSLPGEDFGKLSECSWD
jgi:hypothetical protein